MNTLFPYFGTKKRIAWKVWEKFGNPSFYVEPFFGSGAVLFNRPKPFSGLELVNDLDGLLCNFWRALKADKDGLFELLDWPQHEIDLYARKRHLIDDRDWIVNNLSSDVNWYHLEYAAWWVFGMSSQLGCKYGNNKQKGIITTISNCGVVKQDNNKYNPHGSFNLHETMTEMQNRIKNLKIYCGDWKRICSEATIFARNRTSEIVGIFLDPPYSETESRKNNMYAMDSLIIYKEVEEFCKKYGENSRLRIAVCGNIGDYDLPGWTQLKWKRTRGMSRKHDNRKEVMYFSPYCLKEGLFI